MEMLKLMLQKSFSKVHALEIYIPSTIVPVGISLTHFRRTPACFGDQIV